MDRKTTFSLLGGVLIVLAFAMSFVASSADTSNNACQGKASKIYTVNIKNSKPSTSQINAKLCDRLTFRDLDHVTREIAFGAHENHVPYDGVAERVLNQNQGFTITLNQTGTFHWHDHEHDEVEGYFTVSR